MPDRERALHRLCEVNELADAIGPDSRAPRPEVRVAALFD